MAMPAADVAVIMQRRLFSVEEYHCMAKTGIFAPGERVELVRGEIIQMTPIGDHHSGTVDFTAALLNRLLDRQAVVRVQNPLRQGGKSEFQPDIALLHYREDYYRRQTPTEKEVYWLIEVSDSSLNYDKKIKIPHYAESHIPELWIVNLMDDRIEVYKQPESGKYTRAYTWKRGDSLSPASFPHVHVKVDEILG